MTYLELYQKAEYKLNRSEITLGEFEKMIEPLNEEIREVVNSQPVIQPDKDKVSDLLYRIYSIQSPHLDMCGVIAKKYYCEELWKELYGEESELPWWMS